MDNIEHFCNKAYRIIKKGWKYGAGAGLLKRGGGVALFLLNFLKLYHFYVQKLLYPLQNCVMHLKKNYFFLPT